MKHVFVCPGIDGKAKMSKSLGNCIYLSEEPEDIKKKVMSACLLIRIICRVEDPGQSGRQYSIHISGCIL